MYFIASQTLSSPASTITFSNIPQDFTHLKFMFSGKEDNDGTSNWIGLRMQFNGDTGTNYSFHGMCCYATTGGGAQTAEAYNGFSNTYMLAAVPSRGNGDILNFGGNIIEVLDYADTTKFKTMKSWGGFSYNSTPNRIDQNSGNWRSNSAITSVTFTMDAGQLCAGSRIDLYGITSSSATGA